MTAQQQRPRTDGWVPGETWNRFYDEANRLGTVTPLRRTRRRGLPSVAGSVRRLAAPIGSLTRVGGSGGRRRFTTGLVLLAVVGVLVVAVVAGMATVLSTPDATPPPHPAASSPAAPQTTWTVSSTDSGSRSSAQGVIAAFEHAYYDRRNGELVRSFAAAESAMPTAAAIQKGIDTIAPGTVATSVIEAQGGGVYAVAVREDYPGGGEPTTRHQVMRVSQQDGVFSIVSLAAAK